MNYNRHNVFEKDVKSLKGIRYQSVFAGLYTIQRLIDAHFHPTNPVEVIGQKKLARIAETPTWQIWKIRMAVPGFNLKPEDWPHLWFAISGDTVTFLTVALSGYPEEEMDSLAVNRTTDLF